MANTKQVDKAAPLPIAKYQGSSYWGEKFGDIHYFTIQVDMPSHKLVAGTSVTDKMIRELGGDFDLTKLNKGDLVYPLAA